MSADKYTPGPWAWGTFHKMLVVPVIDGHPYKHAPICVIPSEGFPHDEEDVANANLIASAPRLLAALEAMLENGGDCTATRYEALAAIAQARGQEGGAA